MEENVIGLIAEAEENAARTKERAEARAAVIAAAAEAEAAQISSASEAECRQLREEGIRNAELAAEEEYGRTLAAARLEAKRYADGLLGHTDGYVADIVGRLTK